MLNIKHDVNQQDLKIVNFTHCKPSPLLWYNLLELPWLNNIVVLSLHLVWFQQPPHLYVGWCQRCATVYELSTPISPVMAEMRLFMSYPHPSVRWCLRCASVYELSTPISRVMLSKMRLCLWAIHTYQSGDVRDAPLFMSYSHLSVRWCCQRCASVYELFTPISRVMSEMRLCL